MYHYEMLNDERFQHLCQALISATCPNAQCLPVGQPDGGRDAYLFQYHSHKDRRPVGRDLIVFQVKFVKKPKDSRTEREMIEEVVKSEMAKIGRLKNAGLSKYYLITNLRGTSHPDTGSIDRVNELLTKLIGVESYCWWRDDLDRRIDHNTSIKWSYPDILKATDLLEKLVSGHLGEDQERRQDAIRAYLATQYEDDQELKFKQTELRSSITDLFVDVPMRPTELSDGSGASASEQTRRRFSILRPRHLFSSEEANLNAARYFIEGPFSRQPAKLHRIVLEGAPGQGKSTVTQYICQVMRMQLLNKSRDLRVIPASYRRSQVRLPFRVDMRDLAKWIAGVDPFQSKHVELDDRIPRSLEGFLAAQVSFCSGGHTFNVSDLAAVVRTSHLFLALDGFDEVADVELRHKLDDEITKSTSRLSNAGGFSVQTMVTSRPAAFAKSVRFPIQHWDYYELLPLERRHVNEYTANWMTAKGLKEADQVRLRRLLDAKLQEPHTQYLAKNPMQLTILLSLIHNRGASLPEKRTAMYDAYMDMFFSRESEKSDIVRDNRDILIDMHRHLAWKLQTAAESGENGSIEQGALRTALFSYLDREGENTSIVDELFDGIIERVGALVSRVQGTYEFEVQPLREYFAARYLYETAPYPNEGDEAPPDKFDRFRALIANPYWLNVARFFAGCFTKGEILTLVNELLEFSDTDAYRLTSQPRLVALMFLGDWVFTQYQPAVKKVVAYIGEYPRIRQLLANAEENGTSHWSGLSERNGRAEFVERLWSYAVNTKHSDELRALANAISQNASLVERTKRWRDGSLTMEPPDWIRLGKALGIFSDKNKNELISLPGPLGADLISALTEHQCFESLDALGCSEIALDAILKTVRLSGIGPSASEPNRLAGIAEIFGYFQYLFALTDESGAPLNIALSQTFGYSQQRRHVRRIEELVGDVDLLSPIEQRAASAYIRFLGTQTSALQRSLKPWTDLVESLRAAWGDCAATDRIAIVAAGVHSKSEIGTEEPLTGSENLTGAARYCRLKSGAPRWWEERLRGAKNVEERRRLLLLLSVWATPKTLIKLSKILSEVLPALSDSDWANLIADFNCLAHRLSKGDDSESVSNTEMAALIECGPRACMFVGQRLFGKARFELGLAVAQRTQPPNVPEMSFSLQALTRYAEDMNRMEAVLPVIKQLYLSGASSAFVRRRSAWLPESAAQKISAEPQYFPLWLVSVADSQLHSIVGANAPKLLDVAQREGWFSQ